MTLAWSQTSEILIQKLGSSQSSGLSLEKVRQGEKEFGKNILKAEPKSSNWTILFRQFNNPMVYTLSVAAIIAGALGEALDAGAILTIVIINAVIGFTQESKSEAAIHALKKLTVPKARVLRDGKIQTIQSEDVLPGDILQLEAGDYVVADARVLEAFQLAADEAILTGESLPVLKNTEVLPEKCEIGDRKNMLFAGTAISSGSGKALVTSTGMKTEIGNIAGLLESSEQTVTPLQSRLEKVSHKLLLLGAVVILCVAVIGVVKGDDPFTIFMAAISLAVAAIPEGLPTVVTLALTLAVKRMTQRKALIRNLSAVETLGSTDVICTDKTGTLTTGKMLVREVFDLKHGIQGQDKYQQDQLLMEALILCNNASLDHGGSGDTTELALLILADNLKLEIANVRQENRRVHEWSFESDRKRMSVAIDRGEKVRVYCKGAPETVIPVCQLSAEQKSLIEAAVNELSKKGRRILAVATKEVEKLGVTDKTDPEIERDLTFLGFVALADPPKEETIEAIKKCRAAGIKVAMITGDHPVTANAIAKELGIPDPGVFDGVLTGQELNAMESHELKKLVESTAVYARVTPEHKLRIIEALQANGHTVSMTGDGVNDAPALKKASIGVAMGKAGTEVARQASAMVLTDDNFSTIVAAVEEGRAIFGNIKRTIQYLLSTNLAEIMVMFGAVIIGLPVPVAPLALLWINLVTDGFPSLALAAEPVSKDYLSTSHRPSPESFFDKSFMRELYLVAALMTVIELVVYYYVFKTQDPLSAKSIAFNLLVYLCLFRSFSCRSEEKTFFELPFNPWHLASVIIPLLFQTGLQNVEVFQRLFKVRALTLEETAVIFGLSLLPVTAVEIVKIIRRRKTVS